MSSPATLPADFFGKSESPATLPADFFPSNESDKPSMGHANPAADFVAGGGAELTKHLLGAYHLIRQIPGVGDKLPEPSKFIQSLSEVPDNFAGKAGSFVENAAEYAIPSGAAEKAAIALGGGRLERAAAQFLAGVGVAGLDSGGDPTAMAVGGGLGAAGVPAGDLLGYLGNKILSPETLYRSALKPTRAMMENTPGMIREGLESQLPVSPKSLAVIHQGIEDLRDQINNGVAGNFGTVDPSKVVGALDELRSMYERSANPSIGGGVKAIDKVRDAYLRAHGGVPLGQAGTSTTPLDLAAAQAEKINTHILLRNAYGDMKGAEVEATKQAARGLKEQIESVFPEIAGLNEKQSNLMGLDDALSRRVWQMENQGGAGFHNLTGAVGKALEMPELRSRLAIALAAKGIDNPGTIIASRLKNLISAGQAAATPDYTPPGTAGIIQ